MLYLMTAVEAEVVKFLLQHGQRRYELLRGAVDRQLAAVVVASAAVVHALLQPPMSG